MPIYNRGGKSMMVGRIGKLNCIRQFVLLPGERLSMKMKGDVRLSPLKQLTSVNLDASIEAFAQPIRWLDDNFVDYIKEGQSTALNLPTITSWNLEKRATSGLGVGRIDHDFWDVYAKSIVNIWNEWYRWPEDTKESVASPPLSFFDDFGKECVNLPSAQTRLHDTPVLDSSEYQVGSAVNMDVRDLAAIQARYSQAAKTDWSSQERYTKFMQDVYGARGSKEVDQIPTRLQKGAQLSVKGRDLYATDGSSLGEKSSINAFGIDHTFQDYIAPEHMIISVCCLLRFMPIFDSSVSPYIYPDDLSYAVVQGDGNQLGAIAPVPVKSREVDGSGTSSVIGYLPSGWQLREGYNHIAHTVLELNNFPLLDNQPLTAAGMRDASKIGSCFRSTALEHYFGDINFQCNVDSRIPPAGTSIMSGGDKNSIGTSVNHPDGGWLM